jgi:hypothetical protein
VIVTCAHCCADWPEDAPEVDHFSGDWWCTDPDACNERYGRLLEDTDAL